MAAAACQFCSKYQSDTQCHGGEFCLYRGLLTLEITTSPQFEEHFTSILTIADQKSDDFAGFLGEFRTQECNRFLKYALRAQELHAVQIGALEQQILDLQRETGHDGLWYRRLFLLAERLVQLVDGFTAIVGRLDSRGAAPASGGGDATSAADAISAVGGTETDVERVAEVGEWGQWARSLIPAFGDIRLIARWLRDFYRWLSDFQQFWASLRANDRSDR